MRISAGHARRIAALLAILLIGIAGTTTSNARAVSSSFRIYLPLLAGSVQPSVEQQVIDLTNQQRQQHGCATALMFSPQLTAAASAHSQDMALHNLFSHTGSNGSTMVSRVVATGYSYSQLAENVAAGHATPEPVVDSWMKSTGHRTNILNCDLRELGVGYYVQLDNGHIGGPYRYYWTQVFGTQ